MKIMTAYELLRSIYGKSGKADKAKKKLIDKGTSDPQSLEKKIRELEKYWIDNQKKLFAPKAEELGILEFCKKLHLLTDNTRNRPNFKPKLATDFDFYLPDDWAGVWYILTFDRNQMEKKCSTDRLLEWKLLTDMLEGWGKRYCMSMREYRRTLREKYAHFGMPFFPGTDDADDPKFKRRKRTWENEKIREEVEKRERLYKKWGVEKPEQETESVKQQVEDLKQNLRIKFGLENLKDVKDEVIAQLCDSIQSLEGFGIHINDIEGLLREGRDLEENFRMLGHTLQNAQANKTIRPGKNQQKTEIFEEENSRPEEKKAANDDLCRQKVVLEATTIRYSKIRSELLEKLNCLLDETEAALPENPRSLSVSGFNRYFWNHSSGLSEKQKEEIRNLAVKAKQFYPKIYFPEERIKEKWKQGYRCVTAAGSINETAKDELVQLEYLVKLMEEGKLIKPDMSYEITACAERTKEELKEAFIKYRVEQEVFDANKINLEDCIYRLNSREFIPALTGKWPKKSN